MAEALPGGHTDQPQPHRRQDGLGAALHPQLGQDVAHMALDGDPAQLEPLSDLLIGLARMWS